jgi:pantoate--beta-alanine ligase
VLSRALRAATSAVASGERDADRVRCILVDVIAAEPAVRLDYAEVVDAGELEALAIVDGEVLVAVAVFVGSARLIDNARISVSPAGVEIDLGVVSEPSEV